MPKQRFQGWTTWISKAAGKLAIRVSTRLSISLCYPNFPPSVPYAALTKTFALIEATTKRLEKTALLTSFLYLVIQRSADGDSKSLLQAVYLCINRVRRRASFLCLDVDSASHS